LVSWGRDGNFFLGLDLAGDFALNNPAEALFGTGVLISVFFGFLLAPIGRVLFFLLLPHMLLVGGVPGRLVALLLGFFNLCLRESSSRLQSWPISHLFLWRA